MTRNLINYEWVIELIDEYGDIIDVHHADAYAEAVKRKDQFLADPPNWLDHIDIGLVRDVGNDVDGLIDRSWAYMLPDGNLETDFSYGGGETGVHVPKRFIKEAQA